MWQPIETAPLDGELVDLWVGRRLADCFWDSDEDLPRWRQLYAENSCSSFAVMEEPTHWMPCPAAPGAKL